MSETTEFQAWVASKRGELARVKAQLSEREPSISASRVAKTTDEWLAESAKIINHDDGAAVNLLEKHDGHRPRP